MQFEGGYRYPGSLLCGIFSAVAVAVAGAVMVWKGLTVLETGALFLNLEGTVLLASAFTPVGLTPPQGGLTRRIQWFFQQEGGVALKFSQPLFYGGLLALFLGALLGAL